MVRKEAQELCSGQVFGSCLSYLSWAWCKRRDCGNGCGEESLARRIWTSGKTTSRLFVNVSICMISRHGCIFTGLLIRLTVSPDALSDIMYQDRVKTASSTTCAWHCLRVATART